MRNNSMPTVLISAQLSRRPGRRVALPVTQDQLHHLVRLLASASLRPAHRRRLRVIVLTAEGFTSADIAAQIGISRHHISRVRRRFSDGGVAGLADRPRAGRTSSITAELAARIVARAALEPPPGAPRWTLSLLAGIFAISRSVVYRVLRRNDVTLGGGAVGAAAGDPRC